MAKTKKAKKKKTQPETAFETIERLVTDFENHGGGLVCFSDNFLKCLVEISETLKSYAEEFSGYNSDYIEMYIEYHKEDDESITKEALYESLIDFIHQDIYEFVYETNDVITRIYAKRKLFLSIPEGTNALPIMVEILGLLQNVVDKGFEAMEMFEHSLGYCSYDSPEEYEKISGKDITRFYKRWEELGLEEYEDACRYISKFTTYIEKHKASVQLYELAIKLQTFCILMGGSIKYIRGEATKRKVASLVQFMREFCEKQQIVLLKYRRRSLNNAHNRTITLPEHVGEWKTGQAKKYKVSDLEKNWPDYREVLPNLPALK